MNNIETILKYISGDLDSEAKSKFEELLSRDQDLIKDYHEVVKIMEMIKEQLKLNDLPLGTNREEMIAAITAEHDLTQYRNKNYSGREKALNEELEKIIKESASEPPDTTKKPQRKIYMLGLIITAVAAMLILLILPNKDVFDLASSYYDPVSDPVLKNLAMVSRDESSNAMFLIENKMFEAARKSFEMQSGKLDSIEKLFYAIACNETGDFETSVEILIELSQHNEPALSYKSSWYLALIYIKNGHINEGEKLLTDLKEKEGLYKKKARRMLRKISP